MRREIPFNLSIPIGKEIEYVVEVMKSGRMGENSDFTHRNESLLETNLRARRVLLTSSCTHALEMSSILLDIGTGHEVIVPAFTFVSTANAFAVRGARPVFCDVFRGL